MNTYAVRVAHNKEVVGIFVAPNFDILAAIVDEACDPGICEWLRLGAGGYFVSDATEAQRPPCDDKDEDALSGGRLSSGWLEFMDGGVWQPLPQQGATT